MSGGLGYGSGQVVLNRIHPAFVVQGMAWNRNWMSPRPVSFGLAFFFQVGSIVYGLRLTIRDNAGVIPLMSFWGGFADFFRHLPTKGVQSGGHVANSAHKVKRGSFEGGGDTP